MIADLDLLARVVAHERWPAEWAQPWHPRVLLEQPRPVQREEPGILWRWHPEPGRWLPDPDDHATAGVLLGMVRVGLPYGGYLVVSCDPDEPGPWCVELCPQHVGDAAHYGHILGWACVRALAALWGVA